MADRMSSLQVSSPTLAKASVGAAAAAAVVLTLFVLPAEAGIDITGFGSAIGLTRIVPVAEAAPAPTSTAAPDAPTRESIIQASPMRSDEMTVTLPPHSDTEVKAHMQAGDSLVFRWEAQGGPVRVDMHGEPVNARNDEFTSYWEEGELSEAQGNFTAPFDGTHGWYWRNKGDTPVTVTVRTTGFYQDLFQPDNR